MTSLSPRHEHGGRDSGESSATAALRALAAAALEADASALAARWTERLRTVALRENEASGERDQLLVTGCELVQLIATALEDEAIPSDDLVARGFAIGTAAFERGTSLHHALKGVDLLIAMVLYRVEQAIADAPSGSSGAREGVHLGRRVQQVASQLSLALLRGYAVSADAAARHRFRALRHDLRNPLGTIRSVLTLMDDPSLEADERAVPRFRAMAERNARSLESLITARLSDRAAAVVQARERVSLRTVVAGVRRDLRLEVEARDVTLTTDAPEAPVCVDAASLELVLLALLRATLSESAAGEEVRLHCSAPASGVLTVAVSCVPPRPPVADHRAAARVCELAEQVDARVAFGAEASLHFPLLDGGVTQSAPREALREREAPDDLARPHESDHRQSSRL